MAMLQAARANRLGLPERAAHSWGLNRAIFYAAAKRGFRGGGPLAAGSAPKTGEPAPPGTEEAYHLGQDMAYRDLRSPELVFTIGGEPQTEADYQRQIAARFGSVENYDRAWAEAVRIVGEYDDPTLGSGSRFYTDVYKPRRDELSSQWTERFLGIPVDAPPPRGATRSTRPPKR